MAIRLIIDTSNILFRVASVNNKKVFGTDEEKAGLAMHVALQSVHKYYKRFRPDHLIFAFEGRNNWRKAYTLSEECVSGVLYKGNRVKDSSMIPFFELIASFREVMANHSAATCIADDNCEADDVIAGIVESFPDDEIILVSGDKDFLQLYRHKNFRLIDPATGEDRLETYLKKNKLTEFCPDWFLFEKSVRGDGNDNVLSAYPNVRTTKIRKAFEDEFYRLDFMNTEWTDQNEKKFRVGDRVKENRLLVDLSAQPDWVRKSIFETIERECNNKGTYSHFHFLKFLGKFGLNSIAENIHNYVDMLSCTHSAPEQKSTAKKVLRGGDDSEKNVVVEDRTKSGKKQSQAVDDLLSF